MIALIRADYLYLPVIVHPWKLLISLFLLFAGFVLNAWSWPRVLKHSSCPVPDPAGISSHGLSIFSKYIPGKFWVIMGRAEYLAAKYPYARKDLASLSLEAQFMALWAALLLGTAGLILAGGLQLYGLLVLLLFVLLSLVVFTSYFHQLTEWIGKRILKKDIRLPRLSWRQSVRGMLWYLLAWSTWSLAFWFLAASLVEGPVPFPIAFAFALAGSIGILSVFAPGGLGVREGILTAFLALNGLEIQDATTIGIASRLWFLVGEVFVFLLAFVLSRYLHKR